MMPKRKIFVRHGESEGNVVQDLPHGDPRRERLKGIPDNELRLTAEGVRQAQVTGEWLREYLRSLESSDEIAVQAYLAEQARETGVQTPVVTPRVVGFVSTFARAMETAGHLGLGLMWEPEWRIIERDWGKHEELTEAEQQAIRARKKRNPLYATMPNGQSLHGLLASNRLYFGKLHEEHSNDTVVSVCHGERIWTSRYMLERMTDRRLGELMRSKHIGDKIRNCQIVEYTRINPETGQVVRRFDWMRSFCAWDLREKDLQWKPIVRTKFTDAQLLEYIAEYPQHFADSAA